MKTVADFMNKDTPILFQDQLVSDAILLMREKETAAVLIVEKDKPIGIFTERDIITKLDLNDASKFNKIKIKEVMTKAPKVVEHNEAYLNVIEFMRTYNVRNAPVMKDGQIVGIVSLKNLLTQYEESLEHLLKEKEGQLTETLNKSRDELEQLVRKRTAELSSANDQMLQEIKVRKKVEEALQVAYDELEKAQTQLIQAEKMQMVGDLATGVAHEVKNPLMIIQQGVDFLAKKISTNDKEVHLALRHLESAISRADHIIRDLLDFASVARLHVKKADVNEVLEEALGFIKHHLTKNHIELQKEFQKDMAPIDMDRRKMEQVLIDLFLNAIAAMPGGGTLIVRSYTHKFTEYTEGVGRRKKDAFQVGETAVVIEIEDTGTGIPEENINKIFDLFFTTHREQGGTGLGLSVVKNIVNMHNGRIRIENRKDARGAKATLMLKMSLSILSPQN